MTSEAEFWNQIVKESFCVHLNVSAIWLHKQRSSGAENLNLGTVSKSNFYPTGFQNLTK